MSLSSPPSSRQSSVSHASLLLYVAGCIVIVVAVVAACIVFALLLKKARSSRHVVLDPQKVTFPFRNLQTNKGTILNIIAITAPFRDDTHTQTYEKLKSMGYLFIGISSYIDFPLEIKNPHDDKYHIDKKHDYQSMVSAWLHCFKDPSKLRIPHALISESDFTDPNVVKFDPNVPKIYDIIYVCLDDSTHECLHGWQAYNKNWNLAQACFNRLCKHYSLNILVVGRTKCTLEKCRSKMTNVPLQNYWDFLNYVRQSKIMFVPNVKDASPRVATEALCCGLPIIMNNNIVGGWKYINEKTGEGFDTDQDIVKKYAKVVQNYNKYTPRQWFIDNYGPQNSGKRLLNFLKTNNALKSDQLSAAEYVTFA